MLTLWPGFVQHPAPESDWFKPEGAGWTEGTAKPWLHKLGNLCILNVSQNSGGSNSSFSDKKRLMFEEPLRQGLAAGLSAFGLDRVGIWNLKALTDRHALLVQYLADRWGFGAEWAALNNTRGNDDGDNNDDDGMDTGGNKP